MTEYRKVDGSLLNEGDCVRNVDHQIVTFTLTMRTNSVITAELVKDVIERHSAEVDEIREIKRTVYVR